MLLAALIAPFTLFSVANTLISLKECKKQSNLTKIHCKSCSSQSVSTNKTYNASLSVSTDGPERIVERCLYYALSADADKKARRKNALRLEAPLKDLDHTVQVKVMRQDMTRVADVSGETKRTLTIMASEQRQLEGHERQWHDVGGGLKKSQ